MLGEKVITKDKFKSFLSSTFITKEEVIFLMTIFKSIKNVDIHDQLMYLLYNEYMTLDEFKYIMHTDDENEKSDADITEDALALINRIRRDRNMTFKEPLFLVDGVTRAKDREGNDILIDTSYTYIKQYFIRDNLVTLTLENYQGFSNYKEQMNVIYETLTDDEKALLTTVGITKDKFTYFVRKQMNVNSVEHAEIESYIFDGFNGNETYCGSLYLPYVSTEQQGQIGGYKYVDNNTKLDYSKLNTYHSNADNKYTSLKDKMYYTVGKTGYYELETSDGTYSEMYLVAGGIVMYNATKDSWETNKIFNITQLSEIANNKTEMNGSILKSILNRIQLGTIH